MNAGARSGNWGEVFKSSEQYNWGEVRISEPELVPVTRGRCSKGGGAKALPATIAFPVN